jgi:RNA polymerase sigma-70 factor (ECF subfamily)
VFIAVFKGLPAFRGKSTLRTWIYRITLRVAGRHSAKRRRQSGQSVDLDGLPAGDSAASAASLGELLAALAALPLESRTVLALVAIEGLSHQAAADVLGIPVGTVWSRLHTARRQLTAALGSE